MGGSTALSSLTTDAGGSTGIHDNVTTTGAQTYADDLVIGAASTADALHLTGTEVQFGTKITFDITGRNTSDTLSITGGVNLNDAILDLNAEHACPGRGEVYTLIDNDASDSVVGTFNGLAESATVSVGSVEYRIKLYGRRRQRCNADGYQQLFQSGYYYAAFVAGANSLSAKKTAEIVTDVT